MHGSLAKKSDGATPRETCLYRPLYKTSFFPLSGLVRIAQADLIRRQQGSIGFCSHLPAARFLAKAAPAKTREVASSAQIRCSCGYDVTFPTFKLSSSRIGRGLSRLRMCNEAAEIIAVESPRAQVLRGSFDKKHDQGVTQVNRPLKRALTISLIFLTAQLLNSADAVAGPRSKLVYLLSESRKVIVYVASSGTTDVPTVDVAIELIDSQTSQKIDLIERSGGSAEGGMLGGLFRLTVNSPLELPKADLIEGKIPKGVAQESRADLSRNLFQEGMFVFRVPYSRSNIAVVYPTDRILKTGKVLSFRVFEPKSRVDNFTRHFTFALSQGSPNLREPYSLVTSIADIRDGKAFGYGTLVVDEVNRMYHLSQDWMNLTNLRDGLTIKHRSVALPAVTRFGQTHTSVFDLIYKNDKIAQLSAGGLQIWPNGIDPKEIKDLTYESAPRYRELQTQRIVDRIDSTESSVQATTEFTNALLANAEIASELKRLDATVLHSEIRTISTVGSSDFYVLLKVSSVTNNSRRISLTESFWVIKLNHYTQEIQGTQKLTSLAGAKLETIFPGDLMLTARGKMEKLNFQTPTGNLLCRQLFNSAP